MRDEFRVHGLGGEADEKSDAVEAMSVALTKFLPHLVGFCPPKMSGLVVR